MDIAIETGGLGRRYGKQWALQDATLRLPQGRIAGLVGPNGAGKTTLIHLLVGLLAPTSGSARVFGFEPRSQPLQTLEKVGFVAQNRPLYPAFPVKDMLRLGEHLNAHWDNQLARTRLDSLGIPLEKPVGKLSGGQQAQVALVMALAKHPQILILDEPVGSLDPLARREFMQVLLDSVAENGQTVLLSSHQVADLDRVCDSLIILSTAHVQVAEDIDRLLAYHRWLVCPADQADDAARAFTVLQASHTGRMSTLLVRSPNPITAPGWDLQPVSLDDIILAYLAHPKLSIPQELEAAL
jgi:ABC-2 type transport system ATP-binding protein